MRGGLILECFGRQNAPLKNALLQNGLLSRRTPSAVDFGCG